MRLAANLNAKRIILKRTRRSSGSGLMVSSVDALPRWMVFIQQSTRLNRRVLYRRSLNNRVAEQNYNNGMRNEFRYTAISGHRKLRPVGGVWCNVCAEKQR